MVGAVSVGLEEEGPCPDRPREALAHSQVEVTPSCGGGLSMGVGGEDHTQVGVEWPRPR